jgi:hypothetical protein
LDILLVYLCRFEVRFPYFLLLIFLRHPIVITKTREVRNINRMSIGYAFRPRLRDRLTLSGLTFLRKP